MEVHPPHQPLHSWKDFWIHLGTIAVGLLIAISLEQSVEALHRLHERHVLEDDLRAEGLRTQAQLAVDAEAAALVQDRLVALRKEVRAIRASGRKLKLPYPPEVYDNGTMPSDAVWATAKESALVVLLPRTKAEVYTRLYRQHERLDEALKTFQLAYRDVSRFEDRFQEDESSPPDLSRMSMANLDEYEQLLTNVISASDSLKTRVKQYSTAEDAVLDGATSEEDMLQRMRIAPKR